MNRLLKNAFTLIELLVVIAIIGILSGLIVVTMSGVTGKANIAKSQVFSNSLKNALMLNLVSEWKLDGNVSDLWGGSNGTLIGGSYSSNNCIYGSCVSLDGDGDYIDLGSGSRINDVFNDGQSFTYSLWFYPTSLPATGNWHWLICKAYTSHVSPFYQTDTIIRPAGYLATRVFNNAGSASYVTGTSSASGSVSANSWYFLTVSVNLSAKTNKMYLNGVLIDSKTGSSGTYSNYVTSLTIGANKNLYTSNIYNFTGQMDEVRLYSSEIPSSFVKEQYYAGLNSLLSGGSISKEEYNQRINQLSINN